MKTPILLVILVTLYQYHLFAQFTHNRWGTYFGGPSIEYAEEVAVDDNGDIIMAGKTKSASGIATTGAYQTKFGGGSADAFIAKYDSNGTLLWSTYFGGKDEEYAYGVSVDTFDNIYIGGKTASTTGIATAGSYQSVYAGGGHDGFIAKFSSGGALLWCTYYGGTSGEWVTTITNDLAGNVYAAGFTGSSSGIATEGAHQTVYAGGMDCFLVKFDGDGQRQFGTYLGGTGKDRPHDLQIDPEGNIIMFGTLPSKGLGTPGVFQQTSGGKLDAFISKWTPAGDLTWLSYFGGSGDDRGRECSVDGEGNIYITGFTNSTNAIATSGAHQTNISTGAGSSAKFDAYIAKIDANGQRQWSTYFGGPGAEYGRGLRLTHNNTILVSGATNSGSNISTPDGFHVTKGGLWDSYLAEFSIDGNFIGGTYYGGSKEEPYDIGYGPAIELDAKGNVYMGVTTNSTDIPNALNSFHPGSTTLIYDAVLTKFSAYDQKLMSQTVTNHSFSVSFFPNPANDATTIRIVSAGKKNVTLLLSDFSGKAFYTFPVTIMEGTNEVNVNLKSVAAGTYYVSVPEMENSELKTLIVTH